MLQSFKTFVAASCVLGAISTTVFAQDDVDPNQVLATVNGTEITLAHVIALRSELPQQYDQFPSALLFQGIMDQLIQHTLMMQSIENQASFKSRITIENETRSIMAGEVLQGIVSEEPSEDSLRTLYDEKYPTDLQETEYRASHILVETEDEATALVAELEGGADFATLAREKSTGPSGPSGGDLGWFGAGDMVEPFFNAVVELEQGQVSPPVQTTFGWHVILLAETRDRARPEFDTVKAQLVEEARQSSVEAFVANLREKADITRADTDGINPDVILNFDLLEQ
ncbi:peptidylprolyl isomerase [Roseovarius rhodophyticola]|uniref:Parvulin-like PPIase n=1 Tax=Roseovarius rhodophyticola TaxID=3080827 RepID=A0ABZ2TJ72_9RHOB|nr:peptidylprolyl isomerase [Roseovarius sp. W115]